MTDDRNDIVNVNTDRIRYKAILVTLYFQLKSFSVANTVGIGHYVFKTNMLPKTTNFACNISNYALRIFQPNALRLGQECG